MIVSGSPMRVYVVSLVFGDVPSTGIVAGGAWIAPAPEVATAQFVAKVLSDNPHIKDMPLNGLSVIEIEEGAIRHFVKMFDENDKRAQAAKDAVVTLRPVSIEGSLGCRHEAWNGLTERCPSCATVMYYANNGLPPETPA